MSSKFGRSKPFEPGKPTSLCPSADSTQGRGKVSRARALMEDGFANVHTQGADYLAGRRRSMLSGLSSRSVLAAGKRLGVHHFP
ncbi:MAG: hypothetical protein WBQ95_11055 [Terracidiphilus sp.]